MNNTNQTTNPLEAPERFGYILRLWYRTGQWRASLENLETGKRHGFENLEQLFIYLMDLIEGKLKQRPNSRAEQLDETGKRN